MIRLYYADVSAFTDAETLRCCAESISDTRREKAYRYLRPMDRALCIGAGMLLDTGLREYGISEKTAAIVLREGGKPYLADRPDIRFNLSHSGSMAIACFSQSEVGCDIEKLGVFDADFTRKIFLPEEADAVCASKDPQKAFYRFWTLKESFMKVTGLGLSLPPGAFAVSISGTDIHVRQHVSDRTYRFFLPELIDGYACAVCAEGEESGIVTQSVSLISEGIIDNETVS